MKAECVPLDSEILTRDGFRRHDQITIGEEVLAYDCATDSTIWTPLENVTVHESLPMVRLSTEGRQFDVVCTPDHSWACKKKAYEPDMRKGGSRGARGPYRNRQADRFLIETQQIKTSHRLIMAAQERGAVESVLTPVEAAILGWAVTDGTIQRRGSYVRVGICQSKEENFEEIRTLVAAASTSGALKEIVSTTGSRTFPMTGRTYATRDQHWWYLPAQVSRDLLKKAGFGSRADLPQIATRLDGPARRAMLQAFMLAEGDKRRILR